MSPAPALGPITYATRSHLGLGNNGHASVVMFDTSHPTFQIKEQRRVLKAGVSWHLLRSQGQADTPLGAFECRGQKCTQGQGQK